IRDRNVTGVQTCALPIFYRIFPAHLSFDALYNHTIAGMEKGSSTFTKRYMTGYLRDYLMYIYLFFIVAIGGVLFISGSFSWDMRSEERRVGKAGRSGWWR